MRGLLRFRDPTRGNLVRESTVVRKEKKTPHPSVALPGSVTLAVTLNVPITGPNNGR